MDYAPTCGVNVSAHISPEAARVLVDAHEALQKLGFKPTLTLTLMPKPEPPPEPAPAPPSVQLEPPATEAGDEEVLYVPDRLRRKV